MGVSFFFEAAITLMNSVFPIFLLHTELFPKAGKWCFLVQRGCCDIANVLTFFFFPSSLGFLELELEDNSPMVYL